MMKKKLFAGALAAMLAFPAIAQADDKITLLGSVLDWYYYGKDIHTGEEGWNQQPVGGIPDIETCNYGMMALTFSPNGQEKSVGFLIKNWVLYGNAGGVWTGDYYYTFFQRESDNSQIENMEGNYGSETWEVVVRRWNLSDGTYETWGTLSCSFTDLTYDPLYDKVYGIAYLTSGNSEGYKLVEVDLSTKNNIKVTPISREAMMTTSELRCLAIDNNRQLYGLDASGNFYKVSRVDGTLTQVGNIGFKSQRRMMSATFDLRTNKLYWLGYQNDGKASSATDGTNNTLSVADGGRDTGLYEIDVNTGNVTKIFDTYWSVINHEAKRFDQYGKIAMAGIWIDGSFEKKDYDQKIELTSVPSQMTPGQEGTIKLSVKNIGKKDIYGSDYTVNVYVNGVKVESPRSRDLDPSQARELETTFTAPSGTNKAVVYAEIVNNKDQEARNNKTEEVEIVISGTKMLPTVELSATQQGSDVNLTWQAPDGTVTEDVESYAAFAYQSLSEWTLVDGDGAYTMAPNSYNMSVSYPNANTPKAFIVFDPEKAGINLTGSADMFAPHSGNQYLAAFYSATDESTYANNDDWLISPQLSGEQQTISFWAKGYQGTVATGEQTEATCKEMLTVLYSTSSNDVNSFTAEALPAFQVENSSWTKYEATLPAGTKYFALRRTTTADDAFVMMIDDINFKVAAQTPTSYHVYQNGQLVATVAAGSTSYTVSGANLSSDGFTVSAVYDSGESMPSNTVGTANTTAIEQLQAQPTTQPTRFYNLSGQLVSGTKRPGLYIVQQGGQTRKVVIK